ncbi:C-type lectin domain family 4 member A isoform X2 [Ictalurus punctatus]|uniref:C-type lectin domain family 4 member A isoform X2 n=1 Tax=Ictalurus punctatus TaxID=7998 RepID=A0A2D0SBQ5_ICTPU|nr:C-type lectin domain family 4 member A isoform X2 [Ictalurus punctatus]
MFGGMCACPQEHMENNLNEMMQFERKGSDEGVYQALSTTSALCCLFVVSLLWTMKQNEHVYGNITPTSMRDEGPGSERRCGYSLVISLSVLFLSLMANALQTYFYIKLSWASDTLSEQARNYSAGDRKIKHVTASLEQVRRCSLGDEMSWISSRENCQELGGDLVIINSEEEHKFLVGAMNTISNSLHWIGLRNAEKHHWWLWVDKTPLMQNLSWWRNTVEDSTSEREECVGYYDGQWVDLSCSTSERRICEIICIH